MENPIQQGDSIEMHSWGDPAFFTVKAEDIKVLKNGVKINDLFESWAEIEIRIRYGFYVIKSPAKQTKLDL